MTKQIYWCAVNSRSWGKRKDWPMHFHKTAHHAKMEVMNRKANWPKQGWIVKRVLMETKDAIHYDIYTHEYKRIKD